MAGMMKKWENRNSFLLCVFSIENGKVKKIKNDLIKFFVWVSIKIEE